MVTMSMKNTRTDFRVIMNAIHATGLTDAKIAEKTQMIRSKVTKIRLGHSLGVYFNDGVRLCMLADDLGINLAEYGVEIFIKEI